MTTNHCRSCNAQIVWAETERGKRIPLDAQTTTSGNILLVRRPHRDPLAVYKSADERAAMNNTQFFVSHFVTCPQSAKWRKTNELQTTTAAGGEPETQNVSTTAA